jgi:hypothetical protein
MTRALPRTNFHSSNLLRGLADLALLEPVEPEQAFAEKLGLWIHFTDAITLAAVHSDGMPGAGKSQTEAQLTAADAARIEFERIQTALTTSIMRSCSPRMGKTHINLPTPRLELPLDLSSTYAPYHRFYQAHQREMELSIQPLRMNVRALLARSTPAHRKLADLDATLEKILRERESKRYEQLFKTHQQQLAELEQADNPALWTRAGGWLARFCTELQTLLLAELDLRLQPTTGLIEALRNE